MKEQLIQCFENLDILGSKSLVERDDIFEETSKWLFLAKYQMIFTYIMEKQGFSKLIRGFATCKLCEAGQEVVSFNNLQGGINFGIRFKVENEVLTDILECNSFTGFFKSLICEQNSEWAVPIVIP